MSGLYIHVPFCAKKCRYCDFYSVPFQQDLQALYLEALKIELSRLPDGFEAHTVYVGGGTPTVLPVDHLKKFMELIRAVATPEEWTVEVNPGTLTREKADILRSTGANRVSLGVQSFVPADLALLGRIHTAAEAVTAFSLLREAGFENLSMDLMYAIPGSLRGALADNLQCMLDLKPEHVACYALTFEEHTELTRLRDAGEVEEVDDDEQLEQYRLIQWRLEGGGWRHYEISNFARPGFECRHNLLYWSGGDYIGCGPAAHSHWDGTRWANIPDVKRYGEAVRCGESARDFEEKLEPEAKARETLVMSLRRLDGVSREEFLGRTGFDYRVLCGTDIARFCRMGMLTDDGDHVRLTKKGLFVSDAVFAELI